MEFCFGFVEKVRGLAYVMLTMTETQETRERERVWLTFV